MAVARDNVGSVDFVGVLVVGVLAGEGIRAGEGLRVPADIAAEITSFQDAVDAARCDLRGFTGGLPWSHLDIAGPARSEENSGYLQKGGTAFGVRLLVELIDRKQKAVGANLFL